MTDERMKPEDVRAGMVFRDCDARGYGGTIKVLSVNATHAMCRRRTKVRIRLDRLTNPRLYERVPD